jgi:hypothetical protein
MIGATRRAMEFPLRLVVSYSVNVESRADV